MPQAAHVYRGHVSGGPRPRDAATHNFIYATISPQIQLPISQIICRVLYLNLFLFCKNLLYCIISKKKNSTCGWLLVKCGWMLAAAARYHDQPLLTILGIMLVFHHRYSIHFPNYLSRFIFKNLFFYFVKKSSLLQHAIKTVGCLMWSPYDGLHIAATTI